MISAHWNRRFCRTERKQERYLFRGKTISGDWAQGLLANTDDKWYISNKAGRPFAFEIRPESICQCTGLKDKNGKLIWENDIVKDDVIYGVVKWDDANARYIIDDRDDGYQEYSDWWHEVEIIGNVFDNPELLEV